MQCGIFIFFKHKKVLERQKVLCFFAGKRSNNINQVLSMPPHHFGLIFTGMKEKIVICHFFISWMQWSFRVRSRFLQFSAVSIAIARYFVYWMQLSLWSEHVVGLIAGSISINFNWWMQYVLHGLIDVFERQFVDIIKLYCYCLFLSVLII